MYFVTIYRSKVINDECTWTFGSHDYCAFTQQMMFKMVSWHFAIYHLLSNVLTADDTIKTLSRRAGEII